MNLREAVEANINEYKLIESGDRVLVGLSGGADSVCLLVVLNELRNKYKFALSAIHINHGLRDEAMRDAAYSEELCAKLDIPYYYEQIDVKGYSAIEHVSAEEAGRILRYRAFDDCMKAHDYNVLATAHHANDLAETMLLFLARGTGIKGLTPIRYKNGNIIRPLINITKKQ